MCGTQNMDARLCKGHMWCWNPHAQLCKGPAWFRAATADFYLSEFVASYMGNIHMFSQWMRCTSVAYLCCFHSCWEPQQVEHNVVYSIHPSMPPSLFNGLCTIQELCGMMA